MKLKPDNVKTKTIYLPFAPSIAFKVKNSYDIICKLDSNSWNIATKDRQLIVTNFGGLFETYFSLSYFEALNKLFPNKKLYFNGNNKFSQLIHLNGLSSLVNLINEEQVIKYPSPIFLDKNNNTYFNCLNNYTKSFGYNGKFRNENYKALSKHLFKNLCLDWNINYIPQLRNIKDSIEFDKYKKFNINKPFVLIFPDSNSGFSIHSVSTLGWNVANVKSFASMLSGKGVQSVIVTKHAGRYTGINSVVLSPEIENILYLIEKCGYMLSEEVDFLLIGLLLSKKCKIFSKKIYGQCSVSKNQEWLGTDKELFLSKELSPIEVYKEIK